MSLCIIKGVIPENPQNETLHFRCPFMPFTPGLCMFINMLLFLNLQLAAVRQLIIYMGIAVKVYFAYGIFFSRLTVEKQMLLKKENKDMENEYEYSILEPGENGRRSFFSCFKGDEHEETEKQMTDSVKKPKKKETTKKIEISDEDRMTFANYPVAQPVSSDMSRSLTAVSSMVEEDVDERRFIVNQEFDKAMDSGFSKSSDWVEINTEKGSDDCRYTYTKYSGTKTPSPNDELRLRREPSGE